MFRSCSSNARSTIERPGATRWLASRWLGCVRGKFMRMALKKCVWAFGLLLLPWMTNAAESSIRPNIIFILMDDLRWDGIDYPFVKVPNIQRIAREGVTFANAFEIG